MFKSIKKGAELYKYNLNNLPSVAALENLSKEFLQNGLVIIHKEIYIVFNRI